MPRQLIIDSSTLFAFEKSGFAALLQKLDCELVVPVSVKDEIEQGKGKVLPCIVKVVPLKGRSLKKSSAFEHLGVGRGEAECCVLAARLKSGFIVCDDRKFLRQRFFSDDEKLKAIKVVGFAFLLHLLFKKKVVDDVWSYFNKIISSNNWQRSEVHVANYTFLKALGY